MIYMIINIFKIFKTNYIYNYNMNKYFCEYKILPDNLTRDDCMTLFGGMTHEDDLKELGKVNL